MAHDARCAFARHPQCRCSCGGSLHGGGFSTGKTKKVWSTSTSKSRLTARVFLFGTKSHVVFYADRKVSGNVRVYGQVSVDVKGLRTESGLYGKGWKAGIEEEHMTGTHTLVFLRGKELRIPLDPIQASE